MRISDTPARAGYISAAAKPSVSRIWLCEGCRGEGRARGRAGSLAIGFLRDLVRRALLLSRPSERQRTCGTSGRLFLPRDAVVWSSAGTASSEAYADEACSDRSVQSVRGNASLGRALSAPWHAS